MRARKKRPLTTIALLGLVLLCAQVRAQSLNRDIGWGEQLFLTKEYYPLWDERYENYSLLSYKDFRIERRPGEALIPLRPERPTYDRFGSYLLDGTNILLVEEYRTLNPDNSSRIPSGPNLGQFRNLVVLRDSYGKWSTRFMIGNRLEAHFTPLTLSRANYEGIRWDASSHKNSFTVLTGRISQRATSSPKNLAFASYLYGGHWQSQLGDIVSFGASYVNVHRRDTQQRGGDFRGVFPSDLEGTASYFLILSDDSPGDEHGVQVFDVEIYINDELTDLEPDIRRVLNVVAVEDVAHVRRNGAWAPQTMRADRLLKPDQPLRGRYFSEGVPASPSSGPQLVGGTDLLIYRFEVPAETESVRFRALAAGDYSIDVGASFPWRGLADRAWTDWHNVKRAPGNVRDGSNLRWVSVRYGFPTGVVQFGSNVKAEILGTTFEGEIVNNVSNYQFPLVGGHHNRTSQAYFAKVLKEIQRWNFGAEYFDLPATFNSALPMWVRNAKSGDWVQSFELVEDNDDRDEWPDDVEHWDPLDPEYVIGRSITGTDIDATSPPNYLSTGGPTIGVHPGLDEDQDGFSDTNANRNELPDYVEPFLMYYVESDEFVYGDDFNNNGVVDGRENDNRPDYPYELDHRGYHAFVAHMPAPQWDVRLGRYDIEQSAGHGRNRVSYLELRYQETFPNLGRLLFNYRLKRVRDDIPNPVYQTVPELLSATNRAVRIRPDRLLMRNSLVNTLFLKNHYSSTKGLNLINVTELELNDLRGRGERGAGGSIVDWTLVSKADYARRVGKLTVTPMVKLLLQKRSGPAAQLLDQQTFEIFPILRLDYALTERTVIRTGLQGLPGFQHIFRSKETPTEEFDARHWIVAFQTQSSYTGYVVNINVAFRSSRSRFISQASKRVQKSRQFIVQARVL